MQRNALCHGHHMGFLICSISFPFDAIETEANEVGVHVRSVPNLKSQAHL
jgi:hypothetical protein